MESRKEEIVRLYKEENLSIHEISRRMGVRRPTIAKVLNDGEVARTVKPRKKKYEITETPDYSFLEGKVLVCKKTGVEFIDVFNKGGSITQHIRDTHPEDYAQKFSSKWNRMMMTKTGTLWYLPYFDIKDKVVEEKNIMSDEEIIRLYTQEKMSVHKVAEKAQMGTIKIREILNLHGVERKKRGGQVKYASFTPACDSNLQDKMLVCKKTGKKFFYYPNENGVITSHIKEAYPEEALPSAFKRRMQTKTGSIWFLKYFDVVDRPAPLETMKCAECEWVSPDLTNQTGAYTKHIKKRHGSVSAFLLDHPEDRKYFSMLNPDMRSEFFQQGEEVYVVCKECNECFKTITNSHLKTHGLTLDEYIVKWGRKLVSAQLREVFTQQFLAVENPPVWRSKAEDEIVSFLGGYGVEMLLNSKKIIRGVELDIYLPDYKIAIEYNGLYWHSENRGKHSHYHVDKTELCLKHGIRLIHIFSDEWSTKKDIIKNRLVTLIKKQTGQIYARKCTIQRVTGEVKSHFLQQHHLQGDDKSPVSLALMYDGKIVSILTFTPPRINLGHKTPQEGVWEIGRFVSLNVVGAFSKLLKYFIENWKPLRIFTYADRNWSPSNDFCFYGKMGFNFTKYTKPNYSYTLRYDKRVNRFSCRKSILVANGFDVNKSETQIMAELGYDRIWDTGNLKYEMEIKKD